MTLVWHLDLLALAGHGQLVVVDAESRKVVDTERVDGDDASDVVRALRTIMLRTVPAWPSVIVTDHARRFSGVGAAIGIEQRFVSPEHKSLAERVIGGRS